MMFTKNNNSDGFTFIEFIVALGIFVIMSVPLFSFFSYSLKTSEQLFVKNQLLQNARTTVDFITTQIRMANEIEFTVVKDNHEIIISNEIHEIDPLDSFKLHKIKFKGISENKDNTAIIVYNLTENKTDSKYHRVDFGGNNAEDGEEEYENKTFRVGELSRYIANIEVSFDLNLDIVYIRVVTDEKIIENSQKTTPIVLDATISLFNKKITQL